MPSDSHPEFRSPELQVPGATNHAVGHDQARQERLLEYLDGRTSANESRAMRQHLAECAECGAMAREWDELDVQLTAHFKPRGVAPGFSTRVWKAIELLPAQTTASGQPASAPRDSDWPAGWAGFRRHFVWTFLPAALDHLGYAFAAVLAVCLSVRLMPTFLNTWPHDLQRTWLALLAYGLGASAPVALFVLGWFAKRPLRRLLSPF